MVVLLTVCMYISVTCDVYGRVAVLMGGVGENMVHNVNVLHSVE